jgi:hypothetical protein
VPGSEARAINTPSINIYAEPLRLARQLERPAQYELLDFLPKI